MDSGCIGTLAEPLFSQKKAPKPLRDGGFNMETAMNQTYIGRRGKVIA